MPPVQPNVHSFQDMPPRGGYPKIQINRITGPRGPPGWLLFAGAIGAYVYGMIELSKTAKEYKYNRYEARESRMGLHAFFNAEEDRYNQAKIMRSDAAEAEIMKDVPGWKVGENPYSKRWDLPLFDISMVPKPRK